MRYLPALVALIVATSFAEAQQLAFNPGFEEVDDAGWAAGWEIWPDTLAAGSVLALDENMPHTGRASLRISQTNPVAYSRAEQEIAVEPDASYLFRVWVRGEELLPGDGSQGARLYVAKPTGDTADWRHRDPATGGHLRVETDQARAGRDERREPDHADVLSASRDGHRLGG